MSADDSNEADESFQTANEEEISGISSSMRCTALTKMPCALGVAWQQWTTSNYWRNVMTVVSSSAAGNGVGQYIEKITTKSARKGRQHYTMIIYLGNPMRHILGSARSASCQCRLIHKNVPFIHAVAKRFVMAVAMPI